MIKTSQVFQDEMRAMTRKVYGKVQIDYTDIEIDQSVDVETNEKSNISIPNQVADNVKSPSGKIASLDGSWVLGDYKLYEEGDQIGWWGKKLSDTNGNFALPYPTLSLLFLPRPVDKLMVVGDDIRGEHPVDFEINLYSGGTLLYTETIIDNSLIKWEKQLANSINEVDKMELVIKKWNHIGRQIKILEFYTSVQEKYKGEDIISIELVEEFSDVGIGNVSSNEVKLKLWNENRKFDAENKYSRLYGLLKPNRRIQPWIGTEDEMVSLGTFWSWGDWEVSSDRLSVIVKGKDRIGRLADAVYEPSIKILENISLYNLIEKIMTDSNISEENYIIDEDLQNIIIPYAYFINMTYREVFNKIASLSTGQIYCNREGKIVFLGGDKSLQTGLLETYNEILYLQTNYPAEITVGDTYGISSNDYFVKKHTTGKKKNVITVPYETPVFDGIALKETIKNTIIVRDEKSIEKDGVMEHKVPANHLIQTEEQALSIANRLLTYFQRPVSEIKLDWRGNPALELGDVIRVDDYVYKDIVESGNYYIIKQELEYAGYLRAKLEGRRAI